MSSLASQGILVGVGLIPILPALSDDRAHLEEVIKAAKDHGASFILAGGLSMAGIQAERTLQAAGRLEPNVVSEWRRLYDWLPEKEPDYSPPPAYVAHLGSRVREICHRYDLPDRMPRYIPGGKKGTNKRIAELLFLRVYEMEIQEADPRRIWAFRKAAWTVDEMPESVVDIYQALGESGLRSLPGIGNRIASEITAWLREPEFLQSRQSANGGGGYGEFR